MTGSTQVANADSSTVKSAHAVILPSTLAIGFTGHRNLPDEAKSRADILKFLQKFKSTTEKTVYGVSSAAAGGDLLFAESCLQLGLPIRILLPAPKEQFRGDFDDATWARAEFVMQRAMSVEVIGGGETKEERYYECGAETVQQSQMLLALWDGKPSQGLGGTEEIFTYAKNQERPVVWIHSVTGEIQKFNQEKLPSGDPELDFLNALPDPAAIPEIKGPFDLAHDWFLKVDDNASHAAPQLTGWWDSDFVYGQRGDSHARRSFANDSGTLAGIGVG